MADTINEITSTASNKQAKRLQLRRNGFRAPPLTERNFSPKQDHSRATSFGSQTHDLRPLHSLAAAVDDDLCSDTRRPMGILQHVNNSSQRRKRSSGRARIDDVTIFQDENSLSPAKIRQDSPIDDVFRLSSLPRSASRLMSRSIANISATRSSHAAAETTKYIEHLESELAAAQSQLTAMTSPTVMQNRSLKVKALNTEVAALQQEVAQWEAKYRDRVDQEVVERIAAETTLKTQIRALENQVCTHAQKARDLQVQLDTAAASLNAAEQANCELEKRIDAITNLVASPKKNAATERPSSCTRGRHTRQKSVLPRFLTTGNLTLPLRSFEPVEPATPNVQGPEAAMLALTGATGAAAHISSSTSMPPSDIALHRISLATEYPSHELNAPGSASSSNRFSWTPDSAAHAEPVLTASRPSRRMRRFHGGTMMPKPLLLPCTTTPFHSLASADTIQENDADRDYHPFPELSELIELPAKRSYDTIRSPTVPNGRKRALTSADGVLMALRRASAPFAGTSEAVSSQASETSHGPLSISSPEPEQSGSQRTLRDFSSFGSAVGRNLFDELQRVKGRGKGDLTDDSRMSFSLQDSKNVLRSASTCRRVGSRTSSTIQEGLYRRSRHRRSMSDRAAVSITMPESDDKTDLVSLFSGLVRHPITMAKQCMLRAHILSTRSPTVQKLQWWLLNVLVGPLDARRMMASRLRKRSSSAVGLMHYSDSYSTFEKRNGSNKRIKRDVSHGNSSSICLGDPSALITMNDNDDNNDNDSAEDKSIDKLEEAGVLVVHRHSFIESKRLDALFFGRHSLWLWLRFSFTLAFAIGAALREGPGFVLGVQRLS